MKKHVLIIDDDVELCEELKSLLMSDNFIVDCAISAEKGAELMNKCRFHVILLDNKMSGMSGVDFLVKLDLHTRKKVILISGQPFLENRLDEAGLSGSVGGIMKKPIDIEMLFESLSRIAGEN